MGLRGSQAVTLVSGHAVRFLVTLIGRSSIAFPAQWVRGIVTPAAAGLDGRVTWAHVTYEHTDLVGRLKLQPQAPSSETRVVLYGHDQHLRSFAVDKVLGLLDVERTMIQPLPPQFRGAERDRLLGLFADKETVALIANPFWVLGLPLRSNALDVFALRLSEHRPEECETRPELPVAATLDAVPSAPVGHLG
ncbi:MAG: chemotaxis protein CheW [Nitrospira sp.]|jgi:hypothetical protein|nr:chemotaxis protein CheW [Nitrospira sp.]MBS0174057.1 chemotaxis protein CheW [Nitrospira sp.]MBX3338576.1 chemotaxis protein CheW [Nitrospira sp.]MCW5780555.1 chemotaxis protein CheW [Nitrospira sp.]